MPKTRKPMTAKMMQTVLMRKPMTAKMMQTVPMRRLMTAQMKNLMTVQIRQQIQKMMRVNRQEMRNQKMVRLLK